MACDSRGAGMSEARVQTPPPDIGADQTSDDTAPAAMPPETKVRPFTTAAAWRSRGAGRGVPALQFPKESNSRFPPVPQSSRIAFGPTSR